MCRRAAASRSAASATPRYCRSRARAVAIKGEGVARDEGPEPPAVTPYLIREAEEAGLVAVRRPDGATVEEIKDCVARWL